MPEISVIVPVYNVEKYVRKCLESIISQTFHDIEVVVLNDGSTDSSPQIVENIAQKDKRVKLFSHKNMGLGPTRNRGIELAEGKYLAFVDSDDYISPTMLERLHERAIAEDADVTCGETVYVDENNVIGKKRCDYSGIEQFCLNQNTKDIFFRDYYSRAYSLNAVDKLFRADFVKHNSLIFGNNKEIFAEDAWFQLQLAQTEAKISFVSEVCYFYLQRQSSIMHSVKPQLFERNHRMTQNFYEQLCNDTDTVNLKVCGYLAINSLMSTARNMIESDCGFFDYYKLTINTIKSSFFRDRVQDFRKYTAYQLFSNSNKQWIGNVASVLILFKFYRLGTLTIWFAYKLGRKR